MNSSHSTDLSECDKPEKQTCSHTRRCKGLLGCQGPRILSSDYQRLIWLCLDPTRSPPDSAEWDAALCPGSCCRALTCSEANAQFRLRGWKREFWVETGTGLLMPRVTVYAHKQQLPKSIPERPPNKTPHQSHCTVMAIMFCTVPAWFLRSKCSFSCTFLLSR